MLRIKSGGSNMLAMKDNAEKFKAKHHKKVRLFKKHNSPLLEGRTIWYQMFLSSKIVGNEKNNYSLQSVRTIRIANLKVK